MALIPAEICDSGTAPGWYSLTIVGVVSYLSTYEASCHANHVTRGSHQILYWRSTKVKFFGFVGNLKKANHDPLFIYILRLRRIRYIFRCDRMQEQRNLGRFQCQPLLGFETRVEKVGFVMHALHMIPVRQQAKCNLLCYRSSSGNQARWICMMKLVRARDWGRTASTGERWVLTLPIQG